MKEITFPISVFKAQCSRLLDQVATHGNSLVITKRGQPIARVTAISSSRQPVRGSWKGVVEGDGDIVYFDTAPQWETGR